MQNHAATGQEYQITFTSNVMRVPQIADLLRFEHEMWRKTKQKKHPARVKFCESKQLVDVTDQRRTARLVWADRKTQLKWSLFTSGEQKRMPEHTRHASWRVTTADHHSRFHFSLLRTRTSEHRSTWRGRFKSGGGKKKKKAGDDFVDECNYVHYERFLSPEDAGLKKKKSLVKSGFHSYFTCYQSRVCARHLHYFHNASAPTFKARSTICIVTCNILSTDFDPQVNQAEMRVFRKIALRWWRNHQRFNTVTQGVRI